MKKLNGILTTIVLCAGSTFALSADTVLLNDGSTLKGTIKSVDGGQLLIDTAFAGEVSIDQTQISSFSTGEALNVRLNDGSTLAGVVSTEGEMLKVSSAKGSLETDTASVVHAWLPGRADPEDVARQIELDALARKWKFKAGVSISGKNGNSEKFDSAIDFAATLEGPDDILTFYMSLKQAESDNVKSEDETILGMQYDSFFYDKLGWFVREEFERDDFEAIDFRSTSAAGLTYRFRNEERFKLKSRLGLSYLYEDFNTDAAGTESSAGLDVGLNLYWKFADWGDLNTDLTYVPSFDDFGDYKLIHDSSVSIPLGASDFWKLGFGVKNEYDSNPEVGIEDMDTTYYTRLLLTWE